MNKVCELHGDTLEERFNNDMKIILVCVYCQLAEARAELQRIHNAVEEQYVITHHISCERNHAHAQLDEARAMLEEKTALLDIFVKKAGMYRYAIEKHNARWSEALGKELVENLNNNTRVK